MEQEALTWKINSLIDGLDKQCKVLMQNIKASQYVTIRGVFVPNMQQELADNQRKMQRYSGLTLEDAPSILNLSIQDIVAEYKKNKK